MHPISILAQTAPVKQTIPNAAHRSDTSHDMPDRGADTHGEDTADFAALFGESTLVETHPEVPLEVKSPKVAEETDATIDPSQAIKIEPASPEQVPLNSRSDTPNNVQESNKGSSNGVVDPKEMFSADRSSIEGGPKMEQIAANGQTIASTNATETSVRAASAKQLTQPATLNINQTIAALAVDHRMLSEAAKEITRSSGATSPAVPEPIKTLASSSAKVLVPVYSGTPDTVQESIMQARPKESTTPVLRVADVPGSATPNSTTPPMSYPAEQRPRDTTQRLVRTEDTLYFGRDVANTPAKVMRELTPPMKPMLGSVSNIALVPSAETETSLSSNFDFPIDALSDAPRASTPLSPTLLNRPELPSQVARQLADVMHQQPNRPVELALNPVELGRVRMSITADDGGIIVHVLAERPETLDLLRRNIDQLGREFQSLGYESITFSFDQGDAESGESDNQDNAKASSGLHLSDAAGETRAAPEIQTTQSGVDIRL